jgi:hypothetical protein
MTASILRTLAIAIPLAAVADPWISTAGHARPRLAIVASAGAPSVHLREQLAAHLRADFEVVSGVDSSAAGAVVIGTGYPETFFSSDTRVSTVTIAPRAAGGARIAGVHAPKRLPPQTAVHLEVDIDGPAAGGTSATLTIASGGVDVGRASHAWRGANERWRAALDVVPIGEAPFVLRATVADDAGPADGSGAPVAQSTASVLVASAPGPLRVLVYEPRPSWASTFVRRALEGDARFAVSSLTYVSRNVAVRAGEPAALTGADALAGIDVVAVGGLDRLSAADVRILDTFMREGGGSVALLPDGRVGDGPARALVPSPLPSESLVDVRTALMTTPPLPRLDASEMLVFGRSPVGAHVLAKVAGSNQPVVLITPNGSGRVLFSGALDAWRARADAGVQFDQFWRSVFAGLALATPPAIDVDVIPPFLSAGHRARVSVKIRGASSAVSASLDAGEPVRLWPDATPGEFTGSFVAPARPRFHTVEVAVDGARPPPGRGIFVVDDDARPTDRAAPLALLAASHGGVDVGPDDLPVLERHLRETIRAPSARIVRRPMRSPWWLIPFAACLSGEWWMRRRRGLR